MKCFSSKLVCCAVMGRNLFSAAIVALLLLTPTSSPAAIRSNDLAPPKPASFSDGAVATPYDHCGDADLCAVIAYPNGDELRIYSRRRSLLSTISRAFVRVHEKSTLFEYSRILNHDAVTSSAFGVRCGNNLATQMTLDRGLVHLTVDEYPDGSLRFEFTLGEKKPQQRQLLTNTSEILAAVFGLTLVIIGESRDKERPGQQAP
jgi:hypothetical protein